ncbi:MmcQ/YjbR family DNA-binding protein [Micromonospora sp. NPDC092111]|uniref:MmcQ/YjbR family DNA-binding protein n=1 Tax=Micromonospora sp. NPDC092111 TaxID=3364289 RepID=UPI0037FA4637
MATWDDVRRIALALPATTERPTYDGLAAWRVRDKLFVWDRPLRRPDLAALGDSAPAGPVLGARVPDLGAKEALIADDPGRYFTVPHLDGHPIVLVRLDRMAVAELTELIVEAWYTRAPRRLAAAHRAGTGQPG